VLSLLLQRISLLPTGVKILTVTIAPGARIVGSCVYADDDQLTNFGVLLCTVTSTVAELAATENIVKAPAQTMRNAKFLLKYMIILKNV
jgi:hypothetical protein